MGKHLLISQDPLGDTLTHIAAKEAQRQWELAEHNPEPPPTDGVRKMLAVAAEDPIGLHILARRIIFEETYSEAVEGCCHVTGSEISNQAARQRVHRIFESIGNAILE